MEVIEKLKEVGKIYIRPYVNSNVDNMGMQKYDYVVFPGTHHRPTVAAIMDQGVTHYITGLNEFAPDVKAIKDPKEKEAKILEIRSIVAMLEMEKNFNRIEVSDPEFWKKVQTYRPDNQAIWADQNLTRELANDAIPLNPVDNTNDLLFMRIIEAGGIPEIAKSLEDAQASTRGVKWYLDKQINTAAVNTSVGKIKNKALSHLNTLSDEDPNKLFYIVKLLDPHSTQYTRRTLPDVIYDTVDKYINGLSVQANIKKASQIFLDYADMSMEDLKIKAIVKDSFFFKFIIIKADQNIYSVNSGVLLGKNLQDVFVSLKNPLNQDELLYLMDEVEKLW
jgi:hypothetical protein